jgi:hypothetical protein
MSNRIARGGSYVLNDGKITRNDDLSTEVGEYNATDIPPKKKPSKAVKKEVSNANE